MTPTTQDATQASQTSIQDVSTPSRRIAFSQTTPPVRTSERYPVGQNPLPVDSTPPPETIDLTDDIFASDEEELLAHEEATGQEGAAEAPAEEEDTEYEAEDEEIGEETEEEEEEEEEGEEATEEKAEDEASNQEKKEQPCSVEQAIDLDRAEREAEALANGSALLPIKLEEEQRYAEKKKAFEEKEMKIRGDFKCNNPKVCTLECMTSVSLLGILGAEEEEVVSTMKDHTLTWRYEYCVHETDNKIAIVKRDKNTPQLKGDKVLRESTCPMPRCTRLGVHPEGPLGESNDIRNKKGLKSRLAFLRMYCAGLRHSDMIEFGLKVSPNGLTIMHKQVDEIMAAAHMLYNHKTRDAYLHVEVDEFFIGGRKNNKGEQRVEQLCFQSLIAKVSEGEKATVIAFHVRYVPNREAETLQPWIIDMVQDGAHIDADGALSYASIVETAAKRGKRVTYSTVDHSKRFKSADGTNTNGVEGMHMHIKRFLRQFQRIGKDKFRRILRILAAAHLSVPKAGENPNGPKSRSEKYGKCLRAIRSIAQECIPVDIILKMYLPNFHAKKVEEVLRLEPNLGNRQGEVGKSPVRNSGTGALHILKKADKTCRELLLEADAEAKATKKARSEVSAMSAELKAAEKEKQKSAKREAEIALKKAQNLKKIERLMKDNEALEGQQASLARKKAKISAKAEKMKATRKAALSETQGRKAGKGEEPEPRD